MRNARVWFKKDGSPRFISHLDLVKCMTRALLKSKVPLWHTEGFNSRPFLTFSLPLSLGFRGEKESMDIKLIDEIENEDLIKRLNDSLPLGIRVYKVTEPRMKPKDITFADFSIIFTTEGKSLDEVYNNLSDLLTEESILVDKKSKSGIKKVNIKDMIIKYDIKRLKESVKIDCTLMAGSNQNMNPSLIKSAYDEKYKENLYADITRKELYNNNMEVFL